jgi:enamine deaminase RidA (YjgF/YER057c/UK114 family)
MRRHAAGIVVAFASLAGPGCTARSPAAATPRYVNPASLVRPNGYTHVVVAADGRTVYIAGQVAFDSTGRVVGAGDMRAQTEQVFANLQRALASVGATFSDVVKTTTYVTDASQAALVREVRAKYLDARRPPANTLVPVPALARPELLIEVEAVAVLPNNLRATGP